MVGSSSLQNPFNKGFFSAHALVLQSREDQNLIMKPELNIYLHANEIPDWCSNTVTDSSICFTMPTHNMKYKFFGMVLWFVRKFDKQPFSPHKPLGFSFSIDDKMLASTIWPIHTVPAEEMEISYVFYRSYLETPFDGQMKGGERIEVVEKYDKENTVKQIGIHLLYLDQQGTIISLQPAVLEQVLQEVNQTLVDVSRYPVGVNSRVKEIELLLQSGSGDEVRMVGIYGVGLIGKTTLAKEIYNRTFRHFDSSCFLSDVGSEAFYKGEIKLQEKLLLQILRKEVDVSNVVEGVNLIKARLGSKKVLIVLDGVDHIRQLECLAGERSWFGSGSLIIITTRDENLLCGLSETEKYEAKLLYDNEAQQLFSRHAFNFLSPPQEYLELAQGVIEYSGGLPLALAAFGSHLQGRSVEEWGYELKKLREIPHRDIQVILKIISFDGLESDTQSVFLDIACAFHGFKSRQVIEILNACEFYSEIALATLERRRLLERDRDCFVMHDQVRDMGREIVRMESTQDPGKRSRLFNPQEVRDVLQGNKGSEEVEVLIVDPQALEGVNLSAKAFKKMKNLRVLKIDELKISGDLEQLSKELRWLSWRRCPLKCIPSHFAAEKLVILDLCGSKIQEFGADLQCLKKLDLSYCERLKRTPNFNGLLNLEILRLCGCSSLTEIHQSIGNLDKLIELDMSQCERLRKLPRSMWLLKSLTSLNICNCSSLQRLSFDPVDLPSLKTLSSCETGKQRPTSVEMLRDPAASEEGAKKRLSQRVVYCIQSWLTLLWKLQFNLFKVDIPSDIGILSSLEWLDLSSNTFHFLPFNFSKLLRLRDLRLNNCLNLQTLSSVSNLEYLRNFELQECKKLVKITELHNLPCISRIDMLGSSSLQNPFNEGFFSAHALAVKSREDRNLVMKPELQIFFHCNEIPDWCSNTVRASSICFTMPTHNEEYKFLGMVLWFVRKLYLSQRRRPGFSFSIAGKMPAGTYWPYFASCDKVTDMSYVYYRSYLETPFDGQMKGSEKIQVVEKYYYTENTVKQIGVHLLYLDQHGRVISLPAVVDHGRVNLQAPKFHQGMKEFTTGCGVYDDSF